MSETMRLILGCWFLFGCFTLPVSGLAYLIWPTWKLPFAMAMITVLLGTLVGILADTYGSKGGRQP